MDLISQVKKATQEAIEKLYQTNIDGKNILVTETKPEFEGDHTVVLFSFVKSLKRPPEVLGDELGKYLTENTPSLFSGYNVIKGFLNLTISNTFWIQFLQRNYGDNNFGKKDKNNRRVMVEYSSPNTNKPLHMGHLRNNFLGWSVAEIYKANGYDVVKTCIANDRGIHICKSMIAWQLFANGATPETTGVKGDHFVGDFYVLFGEELKKQSQPILNKVLQSDLSDFDQWNKSRLSPLIKVYNVELVNNIGKSKKNESLEKTYDAIKEIIESTAPIMKAAQQMLVDWEAGKPDVIALWKQMNSWVYAGFDETYKRIGSDFDKIYYESNTYLLGKDLVADGLKKGVFFQKEDGSVWIDLTAEGLDEKIVQRKDGTAVYITQDIGLAVKKYEEYKNELSIYVVGDEQNYHFNVLKLICQKMGFPSADGIFHLSYGMVELPTGRMKTREGTVVDADDLVDEMVAISQKHTEELGKVKDFTEDELKELYDTIGLGALKFYLVRVDPKKRMIFNPEESIDFHGFTGPFVQYTHARIKSILRKENIPAESNNENTSLLPLEKAVIKELEKYAVAVGQACEEMNPSVIANYVFSLAKVFNSFYQEHSIANAETAGKKHLRLQLANLTAIIIKSAMELLGIKVPERM